MCGQQLLITFGVGFIASLLASIIIYLLTNPSLRASINTMREEAILPLNSLKDEIPKITEAVNNLVIAQKEKK
ncbi:MAG: hypothetical protein KGZ86_03950 [Candidatus Latescibacteria bacterium]|nr:hypothetical protein [Candidatus Latescibacterota bacterium]